MRSDAEPKLEYKMEEVILGGGSSPKCPKPVGCKLQEGAVHSLRDQVPMGILTLVCRGSVALSGLVPAVAGNG
jgi:hypothetical protein